MGYFLSYDTMIFANALLVGGAIGAVVGIVALTAHSASEGLALVFTGILVGAILMIGYQALATGWAVGLGLENAFRVFELEGDVGGQRLLDMLLLIIYAAFIGGLVMVVSLAPLRALIGAIAGAIMGTVAGTMVWLTLDYLDVSVPVILFASFALGVVLFFFEVLPLGGT
ncbi:MAG: hypothetical protein R3272_00425 [Candidatus Promineifilaceae bacterium]|nr:hypothetical protein [Candidatus Promineifilaceae bacterium]